MPRPKNAAVAREIYAFAVREKGEIRTVVRIVVSCLAVSALRCNVGAIHCGLLSKMGVQAYFTARCKHIRTSLLLKRDCVLH